VITPRTNGEDLVGASILIRAAWWLDYEDKRNAPAVTLLIELARQLAVSSFIDNPAHWIQDQGISDSSGCQLTGASSRVPVSEVVR
jgi:hypothetical protein